MMTGVVITRVDYALRMAKSRGFEYLGISGVFGEETVGVDRAGLADEVGKNDDNET